MVTRQFAQALVNIASASCFAGTGPLAGTQVYEIPAIRARTL